MTRPRLLRPLRSVFTITALAVALLAAGCGNDSTSATADTDATAKSQSSTMIPNAAEITVAAASDLRPAFEELGKRFNESTGTHVTFSFGSSGQLREQVINGAPFDLFASANVSYVDEVIAAGRGVADTKADYAFGRIVLWSSDPTLLPAKIGDLNAAKYTKIAIANPDHAPYGFAAKQALQRSVIYDSISTKLLYR